MAGSRPWGLGCRPSASEGDISRILFMRQSILAARCRAAPCDLPAASNGQFSNGCLLGLAPGGVYHAARITADAVSSYLAISPLPSHPLPLAREGGVMAVYFLLHFPSPHGARALPGTLPCGVRTFLTARLAAGQRYRVAPSVFTNSKEHDIRQEIIY